jgi:hypothetical protein
MRIWKMKTFPVMYGNKRFGNNQPLATMKGTKNTMHNRKITPRSSYVSYFMRASLHGIRCGVTSVAQIACAHCDVKRTSISIASADSLLMDGEFNHEAARGRP